MAREAEIFQLANTVYSESILNEKVKEANDEISNLKEIMQKEVAAEKEKLENEDEGIIREIYKTFKSITDVLKFQREYLISINEKLKKSDSKMDRLLVDSKENMRMLRGLVELAICKELAVANNEVTAADNQG